MGTKDSEIEMVDEREGPGTKSSTSRRQPIPWTSLVPRADQANQPLASSRMPSPSFV
jgi:hypothetical protein